MCYMMWLDVYGYISVVIFSWVGLKIKRNFLHVLFYKYINQWWWAKWIQKKKIGKRMYQNKNWMQNKVN